MAAEILGQPDRADWKRCLQSEEEEIIATEKFKQEFAPFDPTITGDE